MRFRGLENVVSEIPKKPVNDSISRGLTKNRGKSWSRTRWT